MDFQFVFFVFGLKILTILLSAASTQCQPEHFVAAVSKFSSELYQECTEISYCEPDNVAISPFSAINALVLLTQAAEGATLYHLKKCLNFNGTKSVLLNEYVAYQQSLSESARNSTMRLANRLYVQQGYQINPDFQEIATQKLLSGVQMVNFANTTAAAKTINDFVAEKTNNRTGDIIKPWSLSWDAKVVLMNTIYMKLTLDQVFQSTFIDTRKYNAFSIYEEDKNVHYKGIEYIGFERGRFNYAHLKELNAKALEIRFADSDFALVLILHDLLNQKYFAEFKSHMKDYDITSIIRQMRPQHVTVRIPSFQIKHQISLRNISNQIQISNIFQWNKANLSGMLIDDHLTSVFDAILTTVFEVGHGDKLDIKTNKFLSSVRDLYSSDRSHSFDANRPFLYFIWDHKLNTAILSGSLEEFEGKKSKLVHRYGGFDECFDANGRDITCKNIQ